MNNRRELPELLTVGCASGAILLALFCLLAYYVPGLSLLGRIKVNYIPMAPGTALSFIALAAILLWKTRRDLSRAELKFGAVVAGGVTIFGLLKVVSALIGADLHFEYALVRDARTLNGVPIGVMSPVAGVAFCLAGLSVLLLLRRSCRLAGWPQFRHWSGALGCLVWFWGFIFALAYFYGMPLFYGAGENIPMALTTAVSFILLASGVMTSSGTEFPLMMFARSSTSGYLLRYILPLSTLSVIFGGLTVFYAHHAISRMNPALVTALLTAAATIITVLFATIISRHTGSRIDRLEREVKQAMSSLRASEKNLSITLNSIGDAVIATDVQARITQMNPVAETMTGWNLLEAAGKPLEEVFNIVNAKTMKRAGNPVKKVIETGRVAGLANHTMLIAKTGARYHIADSGSPIRNGAGRVVGVVLVFRDVSEEYRLAEAVKNSEIRFRTIFREAPVGMALIDSQTGRVEEINHKFAEICGMPPGSLTGASWIFPADPDSEAEENSKMAQLKSGRIDVFNLDKRYVRPDGATTWINMTVATVRIKGNAGPHHFCMVQDITEARQTAEKLRAALTAAETAGIAKSEFLATMSHEIRTPLNGVLGFTSILKDALPMDSLSNAHAIKEYFDIIEKSGATLLEIINDVLELSSIEAGQFKASPEEFSPAQLIRDSIAAFAFKSQEKQVPLNFAMHRLPEKVIGDRRRLKQILFNLLGNALKFTDHGQVDVAADCADGKLWLTVSDTGIGIPPDKLEKISTPFYQVDQSSTRRRGGSGLGLAIVSRMVEKLGGAFKISSVLHKGTSVEVIFPVKIVSGSSSGLVFVESGKKQLLSGVKVLAVEDDNTSIAYLNAILKRSGAEYQIADSFTAMRKICESGMKPDVVLLDIALPDADGFECLEWLQQHFAGVGIKFIAQTAHVLPERTIHYKNAGFHDFIGKPYSRKSLLEIIKNNLHSPDSNAQTQS